MHRRINQQPFAKCAAAHLEGVVASDLALHLNVRCLHQQRLQEEDTAQRHDLLAHRRCCARELEVARAWEDDAAMHDVVGDEGVQRTRSRRAEEGRRGVGCA